MTLVKICGLCDGGAARVAAEAGADLLGFHFCDSSRRVEPEAVVSMLEGLGRRPLIVGVFINQPLEEIRQISDFIGLDWIQLHGSEEPGPSWPRLLFPAQGPGTQTLSSCRLSGLGWSAHCAASPVQRVS